MVIVQSVYPDPCLPHLSNSFDKHRRGESEARADFLHEFIVERDLAVPRENVFSKDVLIKLKLCKIIVFKFKFYYYQS
jgi:hypothetical protein